MPLTAWDLAPLKNGGFAFCFSTFYGNRLNNDKLKNEQSNYRLFFTDKDLNITHKMFPYTEGGYDALGKEYYFTENEKYDLIKYTEPSCQIQSCTSCSLTLSLLSERSGERKTT